MTASSLWSFNFVRLSRDSYIISYGFEGCDSYIHFFTYTQDRFFSQVTQSTIQECLGSDIKKLVLVFSCIVSFALALVLPNSKPQDFLH